MFRKIFAIWAGDSALVISVMLMTIFGIAMIYSAGVLNVPNPVTEGAWIRQSSWFVISIVVFTLVGCISVRWFEWAAFPLYGLSLILLFTTLLIGTGSGTASGVKSFIDLGIISFQPSEFAKLTTILALARYLATRPESPSTFRALITPSIIVGIPLGLVILQPDLGTALAFMGILFFTLYWAGAPIGLLAFLMSPAVALVLSYNNRIWALFFMIVLGSLYLYRYRLFLVESLAIVIANLAAGIIASPLWDSLAEYQQNRILVFLDPSVDPRGAGYHIIQSMVAIGSGGVRGKGFTDGTQKKLDFVPEQHTDFIFSVIGEELGFLGTGLALLFFCFILYRLVKIAEKSTDPFSGLVIFGILGSWLIHIFVNVGMTVGMVPVTGIPLPFVSYGGTFLLMSWIAVGITARVTYEE